MITLTPKAVEKVISIIKQQDAPIVGLRVAVRGGGCSGFEYALEFTTKIGLLDKTYEFPGQTPDGQSYVLKVVVDQASLVYLDGCNIDYVDGLDGNGFKFNNPNVKSTCGCGSSFQA